MAIPDGPFLLIFHNNIAVCSEVMDIKYPKKDAMKTK